MSTRRFPRAGTVERAVWDAMHTVWCGPDCPPGCAEWGGDVRVVSAAIKAVRAHDDARFRAAFAKELGQEVPS